MKGFEAYFSCRPSRRGLCGPGIRSCRAAIQRALSPPRGASHCCPPASSIWRRWSHTGCPRAPKTTSAALPRRYGDKKEKKKTDSMVINTYVSCLISNANKHIIIHPVRLPLTLCLLQDKRSRDFTHLLGNFHFIQYTWVIPPSAAAVLAELLLHKTFIKHRVSGGNLSEWSCLQSFNCVFSSLCALLLFSWEAVRSPWSKSTTAKEWHHPSCSSFEVKNRGIFTQGGATPLRNADASLLLFLLLMLTRSLVEVRKTILPYNKHWGFTEKLIKTGSARKPHYSTGQNQELLWVF